jgi:Transposase domain (DUF772)
MPSTGVRSSRQIERRCHKDIGFRVLSGNSRPDHVTIARFRVRHEQALAGLLIQSLRLCAAAGMVRVGLVALDGTKVAANVAEWAKALLEAEAAARQQRCQQRVADLAAAARARGQRPRAHIRPRRPGR